MNAKELGLIQATLESQGNLIKKQADRIAELEGEVSHLKHINKNWSISEGWALQRIAELESKLQESALDYISVCSQADEHYARVQELEKQLDKHKK